MIFKKEVWITPYQMMRTLHIYVPDEAQYSKQHYPVFYMYDGHNLFDDKEATYGKSWGLKDYLDEQKEKMIVVGIECNHEGNQRIIEYCPYTFYDHRLGRIVGSGKQMMEWVVQELKPLIDRELPTLPDRNHTWIGGSSMGGLMALYSIVYHNSVFSRAACLSPFLGPVRKQIAQDCHHPLQADTYIYLSWGSNESHSKRGFTYMSKVNIEIANLLYQQDIHLYLNLVPGGQHCEASWEEEIPTFFQFFKQ